MRLRVGAWAVAVDDALEVLARPRCELSPWRAVGAVSGELALSLLRVERGEPGLERWLDGEKPELGAFWVEPERVLVRVPDEPRAAEAALRVLFHLAFLRQGALLLHASGVAFGERGVVATGPSGAGKSTLARLCVGAGADLLSDETVAVHPAGWIHGSPFSSDPDMVGTRREAPLAALLVLEKGAEERISEPLARAEAVALLLSQVYPPDPRDLPRAALLQRAAALAERPGLRRLTFRKDPAAGAFMRGWLERGRAG